MTAQAIIEQVYANAAELRVQSGTLYVRNRNKLPQELYDALQEHCQEVVEALALPAFLPPIDSDEHAPTQDMVMFERGNICDVRLGGHRG